MTEILSDAAVAFVADLNRRFRPRRNELLQARAARRAEIAAGASLGFLAETADIRAAEWSAPPAPADLQDRRVEITGPTERKMTINALNSGAKVWLADLEDANTPHWSNVVDGQQNLYDAIRRTITLETDKKTYELNGGPYPTIVMRPRGWHLDERHLPVDGEPAVGALVDFGLYFFHNAKELLERGSGPYFYLPKMESHREAALWNDVFTYAQEQLGIPVGTIRATVLIETIPAAFEMEEILYALRPHISGLNAGRWDYLFSIIKYFRDNPRMILPDRAAVTMTAPFMRAYSELLVSTCHRRGAFAMGGMAAFIPSRRDPKVNEIALAKVNEDKEREAGDGFDGSWVAHPDLVPVCQAIFDRVLGDKPNQLSKLRPDVAVDARDLLDVAALDAQVTEAGLRNNVNVALQYLEAWLRGNGAVAIHNLMEDAATAEISRSQIWQWIHNGVKLPDGTPITAELVTRIEDEELAKIKETAGEGGRFDDARKLFERVALADDFADFLTSAAYDSID
ncbi:malate synthase [Actinoplanes sp. SE50]|uniref:malate synthase A n=1 Tax=unclassified Actinoplanes TaxID=2626549 RepID=UPI00023EBFD2|nr:MULTISPECIES: malate synthase A [unclassified Actinoplanes]AEV87494.1 malate synthase [Actinoplanes sp. SE50/110]ATO85897.1 malate synthase [Actinoplanes sp. SE50]SLM03311.1 malate synthase A [Actinoplanes sp. SE50/110]